MNDLRFTFSDTIAGYVTSYDQGAARFVMKTSDGREFTVNLTDTMSAELVRNLNEPYADASGLVSTMLVPGRYLFAYGIYYPEGGTHVFEAKRLVFLGRTENQFMFEKQDWWIKQIGALGDAYLKWQFGTDEPDYRRYRT